jgi:hypothetical protein
VSHIKVEVDGKVWIDAEARVNAAIQTPHTPIISNQREAAVLAGAGADVFVNLPGERVIGWLVDRSTTITIYLDQGIAWKEA